MADRSILVTLKANIADFKGKFEQAGRAAKDLTDRLTEIAERNVAANAKLSAHEKEVARERARIAAQTRQSWENLGAAATKGGLVIAAGLGFAVKAAIDWESAWAGVTKTVDGSAEQLGALEGQLRAMARTLPASHTEIAAVAEAAGQLGIKTADVAGFTRVMIDLGETTNLTADEAATSLAQFMNIMGTSASEVSNLGSAIVSLGNNGASTERDIVAMGMRIAAAGKAAGMSETDVLGFASALSSVGVEAEAGGTAISMSFTQIGNAVRKGGDDLELIARTAGMTSEQFQTAWGQNAAGAMESFVTGLGRMQASGQDARGVLDDLGMTGIRQSDSLMRLALAGDLLGESLSNSSSAWDANSALAEEAAKRYSTTESQIKIAWNNIKDAAIDAGAALLPIVSQIVEGAAGIARGFAAIPEPLRNAGVGFAAIAAGGLLAFGGLVKLVTTSIDLHGAFQGLASTSPKLASALGGAGKAAGVLAGVMATFTVARMIDEMNRVTVSVGDAEAALRQVAAAGGTLRLDEVFDFSSSGIAVNGFRDALRAVASSTDGWGKIKSDIQAITGLSGDISMSRDRLAQLDQALSTMDSATAAAAFREISETASGMDLTVGQLADMFPQYAATLQSSANASGGMATASEAMRTALDGTASSAQAAAAAQDALASEIRDAANAALATSGSLIGLESAIDAATESAQKHGATLDINTAAGRANRSALDQIASASLSVTAAQKEADASAEDMAASTARAREQFISVAQQMRMTEDAANRLADEYGLIPADVSTTFDTPGADVSQAEARDMTAAVKTIPSLATATILAPGARPSTAEVDTFVRSVGRVPGLTEAQIRTIADLYGVQRARAAIAEVRDKAVTVTVSYVSVGSGRAAMRALPNADGGMLEQSRFGLARAYADGGWPRYAGSVGSMSPGIHPYAGKAGIIMNEQGSGPWEGIVSGHPGKRKRSRMITEEIASRLGGAVSWGAAYADGGMRGLQYSPSTHYVGRGGDSRVIIYGDVLDWRAVERLERGRQSRASATQTAIGVGIGAAL